MSLFALTPLEIPRFLDRAAGILWAVLVVAITVASMMPNFGPPAEYNVDKILHFLGYGAAAGLPFLAFHERRHVLATALAMAPLGVVLEVLQQFVPGRTAETGDALANIGGVIIGLAAGPITRRIANLWLAVER